MHDVRSSTRLAALDTSSSRELERAYQLAYRIAADPFLSWSEYYQLPAWAWEDV